MLFLFLLLQITRSLITDRWLLALHYRRRGYCTICEFVAFTNSVIMSRRLRPPMVVTIYGLLCNFKFAFICWDLFLTLIFDLPTSKALRYVVCIKLTH